MIYLLELDAWTGSGVETLYLATTTFVTKPSDTPANTVYYGALLSAGDLERKLFDNGGTIGKPSTNYGSFEISNADGSRSSWLDYGVGGRKFRLYTIDSVDADYSTRVLVFTGTQRGFQSDNMLVSLKVRIRDKLEELDKALVTERYGGTTTSGGPTADGDATMLNVLKPRAFGDNLHFSPPCVNSFDLIYQVSQDSVSLINVYDGGVQLSTDGNYATLALLQAATITAGKYATCFALGYFRLASVPAHAVTADCMAESVTWASNNDLYEPGPIAARVLAAAGFLADLDAPSFAAIASPSGAGAYRCGNYITDSKTVRDITSEILSSVSASIISTATDTLKAIILSKLPLPTVTVEDILIGETPVDTYDLGDVGDGVFTLQASPQAEGDGVPAYWINLNYSPYYTTQSKGDLAGAVAEPQVRDYALAFRTTVALDTSIKTVHPLAQTLTFDTKLTRLQGVNREAEHRLNLYGRRRDYVTVTISMDRVDQQAVIDLGDIVALDIDHLLYSPKNFYVIGRHDKFGERLVTLTLWG